VNIAGSSETARKRSGIASTTHLLGNGSGWNTIFGEFRRDLEANAGAVTDGIRRAGRAGARILDGHWCFAAASNVTAHDRAESSECECSRRCGG
jgi:hypothetical protein